MEDTFRLRNISRYICMRIPGFFVVSQGWKGSIINTTPEPVPAQVINSWQANRLNPPLWQNSKNLIIPKFLEGFFSSSFSRK